MHRIRLHRPTFRCVAAALLLVCALPRCAEVEGAGVIAYTRIHGETHLLLADHASSERGWGTFGGRIEAESIEIAAQREFHEETRCIYRDVALRLDPERRVTTHGFVAYVVEVPFVPAQRFSSSDDAPGCTGAAFRERGPWTWVPLRSLLATLAGDGELELAAEFLPPGHRRLLWDRSADSLRAALDADLIPRSR